MGLHAWRSQTPVLTTHRAAEHHPEARTQVIQEDRVPDQEAEASGTFESVALVTIPAALIYFVGWGYLHFYLRAFAIDLSELDLGVETVLIYAVPPIFWLCGRNVLIVAALMLLLIGATGWLLWRLHKLHSRAAHAASPGGHAPHPVLHLLAFALKGGWMLVTTLLVAAALMPALKSVALARAGAAWRDDSVSIKVIVDRPDKLSKTADSRQTIQSHERRELEHSQRAVKPEAAYKPVIDSVPDTAYDDYDTCQQSRRLHLVFSDSDRYFLLCTSEIDPERGAVYEVRREDSALASVRYLRSPS